jgi:hypothetical protein
MNLLNAFNAADALGRRRFLRTLGALGTAALAARPAWADADPAAREIMEKNFFASKIASVKSDATMVLTNAEGQTRERGIASLQKLQANGIDTKMVMKFNAPADIRGVGFLQVEHSDADDDQWIYLPALKKSRRLVANNKKDSFMGSDFSYGDFARPKVDWYTHRLLRSEAVEGFDCHLIESVPATDAIRQDHGYSRKLTWVRKDSLLEAQVRYHDLGGALLKTQTVSDHRQLEPATRRWFALRRQMVNHQTGHKTVLAFVNVQAGVSAPDEVFSTRTIERE